MTYRGNSSLATDLQQRIAGTFEQSLELAAGGKEKEAILGCEFILRMDPDFEPAKTLLERLQGDERPVRVDDLGDGEGGP